MAKAAARKPAAKKAPAKSAKAPAKKEPAKAKPAAQKPAPKKLGDNPFREGTSKAKGYEYFKKVNGDRAKTIAHLESLGIKSAASFYSMYSKV